jgi:undecaprenyl-diphosphatase
VRRSEQLKEWLLARDLELIGSCFLVALLLFAFLKIGQEVREGEPSIDERILMAMRDPKNLAVGIGPAGLPGVVRDITALGSPTLGTLFSLALVVWLLLTGRPGAALFVTFAMVGGWLLNDLLKDIFARERPMIAPHLMRPSDPSFPSGHTMMSSILYPTMAELFGRLVRQRRLRFYLMGLAITVALLVGLSRIYLGVHYPSDVVAGLAMGFAWALACGIVARLLQRRGIFRTRPHDRAEPPDGVPQESSW